jgi:APA family basic amino acid/polyamine antiporter
MSSGNKIAVWTATAVGLGSIIGAGIFVLSGTAIALAGSGALIAFILVGIIALIVAMELAELGTLMPKAMGASYSYTYRAFGSELGFITGILLYFSMATAIAVITIGFGSYVTSLLGMSESLIIPFAIVAIAAVSVLNLFGLKKAAKIDTGLVSFKVLILIAFVAFALFFAFKNPYNIVTSLTLSSLTKEGVGAIFAASVVVFFAYTGFQTISTIAPRGWPYSMLWRLAWSSMCSSHSDC